MEYVILYCILEITFYFTIRLLNKGVPIDILGHRLRLRYVDEIAHLKTFQEIEYRRTSTIVCLSINKVISNYRSTRLHPGFICFVYSSCIRAEYMKAPNNCNSRNWP
jgi:hypothetical protein